MPYTLLRNAFNFLYLDIVMSNTKENDGDGDLLIGKTIRDIDNNSTALIIPKELAKELDIENTKVSTFLWDDFDGKKHLVVTKYYNEIL